ncbi:MAG: type IV pilus modification protein PilV [Burkholderiales bacterium]
MLTTRTAGFTLIEVLVTLVILMFGLLGIAGLMAKGQRASFEAFQRQQALALANDMAERIRTNRAAAPAYALAAAPGASPMVGEQALYDDLLTTAILDCGAGSSCNAANLAAYDLALWDGLLTGYTEKQAVGGASIGGIVNARGCVEALAGATACPAPPAGVNVFSSTTYRVSVTWQGEEETLAPTASACGNGLYGTAARRRLVFLDVLVYQACP